MSRSLVLVALASALCFGCGKGAGNVLSLQGPGGAVALGDDLAAAKKAFPPPKGAQVFNNSLSFAILAVDGWAWAEEKTGIAFEAALKDGKIIALGLTNLGAAQPSSAVDDQKSAVGDPTRLAESDNAAMLVWESGENARFFIVFKAAVPMLGQGAMTLIGPKEQLKLLNYRHDDPESFVKQIDAAMGVGAGAGAGG